MVSVQGCLRLASHSGQPAFTLYLMTHNDKPAKYAQDQPLLYVVQDYATFLSFLSFCHSLCFAKIFFEVEITESCA